ncbi:ABC transporter ATP-binding protein [Oscillospiraceae bacterium 50-16]
MLFNLSSEKIDSIKEYLIKTVRRELHYQEFWALNNISFELEKGDSLGIVGLNGSGKSTLLKVISGILKPTSGRVETVGEIAPLIELGAGFDANLSARENIYLNGAILGHGREYMERRFDDIVAFAELQEFVDTAIKNYSSGMVARLGFAIATMNVPDILIIDEILAVGDYKFQEKSFRRMQEMIHSGATVVFVSHSIEQVKQICKKALWLEHGEMRDFGEAERVCTAYVNA